MDNSYGEFAQVYDYINGDANYKKRTKYMLSLFERYAHKPSLLLDLACGTGEFSVDFSKAGCDVIGVDASQQMLAVAQQKAYSNKQNILFLCQRIEQLDLYGTVDGAVCCFDSINHITDIATLQKAFKKIALFLEDDSAFIFDVNTVYRHENVLAGKTYVYDEKDLYFVWNNEFVKRNNLLNITLDIFKLQDDNFYNRTTQKITERAYTIEQLSKMLNTAGLCVVDIFDDLSFDAPNDKSERLYFVTKKVK